ncbi:glycosyltransferase family 4 protein [Prevotella ihumii]|uniref:glycosyltransferase family 4 protein n=1 Tax=Prevotella ihumii TaxID=1917878 RepID=UPI0009825BBD|nr:glycosyltransferase family 4 protein [Prevotella ihumii]
MAKKKLIRVTTSDISLDSLIKGQLKFLSSEFEVIGVSNNTGVLAMVGEREGIRTIEVPMHREISLLSDLYCLYLLITLFIKEKPFIVHTNTPKGSLLSMIAAWICRVPHRIYTVTGLRYQGATGLLRFILMSMERLSCLFATKVIPEGKGVLHALQENNITKKPLEIVLNGNINGIDTTYFSEDRLIEDLQQNPVAFKITQWDSKEAIRQELRQSLNVAQDDFLFVFIGRIVNDKGMHELAESIKKLSNDTFSSTFKNVKLLLVGHFENGDPLSKEDKDFLTTSENIVFVGWQTDVRPFLYASDALVFPSYREGFPNVPMQAGAMQRPSIVTDINGCNEIIKDGLNGKIIQPRNDKALYTTMKWFVEHTAEGKRMANNARAMIKERYEQVNVWNALLEVYKSLEKK